MPLFCQKVFFGENFYKVCIVGTFQILMGQSHEIFDTYFINKAPPGPHMYEEKTRFREMFRFPEDIREKHVSV